MRWLYGDKEVYKSVCVCVVLKRKKKKKHVAIIVSYKRRTIALSTYLHADKRECCAVADQ